MLADGGTSVAISEDSRAQPRQQQHGRVLPRARAPYNAWKRFTLAKWRHVTSARKKQARRATISPKVIINLLGFVLTPSGRLASTSAREVDLETKSPQTRCGKGTPADGGIVGAGRSRGQPLSNASRRTAVAVAAGRMLHISLQETRTVLRRPVARTMPQAARTAHAGHFSHTEGCARSTGILAGSLWVRPNTQRQERGGRLGHRKERGRFHDRGERFTQC